MTRPESDDNLTHDWHIDGEHATPGSLPFWCPDCLSMAPARLDALCPDRVKRAMDRCFVAGVRAGLEAAALVAFREADRCDKYSLPGQAAVRVGDAVRAIDPAALTEKT